MYSKDFFINCSDVDVYKKLKPSSFFKLFQDLAVESTEVIHFGHEYLDERNLTWVITRVNAEFIRVPDYQETIKIITYPSKNKMIIYPRHFFIKDKDDNIVAKMSSTWALIDKTSHKVASLDAEDFRLDLGKTDDELPLPKHIKIEGEETLVSTRKVMYSDCDLNQHLNNTRYIDFIFDIFESSFFETHDIKTIQVDYLSEIKLDDEINIYLCHKDPYQIIGKVNDKECFIASLSFIKK